MEIKNLIDASNQAIYQAISAHYEVILVENPDWRADAWSAVIRDKQAIIQYADTEHEEPKALFSRELLRINLQIEGYKRILTGVSLHQETQQALPVLLKNLDHHFQIHKIAPLFLAMGYPANLFYEDAEDFTSQFLEESLKESGRSLINISILYLSVIAPLSAMSQIGREKIRKDFEEYAGGMFKSNFQEIDNITHRWVQQEGCEAENHLID